MKKQKLHLQLPLPLSPLPFLGKILEAMPSEKAKALEDSGLIPDIAAAIAGLKESALLEVIDQARSGQGKSNLAIAMIGRQGVDTLLSFATKPTEKDIEKAMKQRRIFPASIQETFRFVSERPDTPLIGPIVATEMMTIEGCRLAGCICSNGNAKGFETKWVHSAPAGALFTAKSKP